MYSCSGRRISFQMKFKLINLKRNLNWAKHEYMNVHIPSPMDLSPFRQNFENNRNRQKYHHSLKEHPTFTKIAKFGCEML